VVVFQTNHSSLRLSVALSPFVFHSDSPENRPEAGKAEKGTWRYRRVPNSSAKPVAVGLGYAVLTANLALEPEAQDLRACQVIEGACFHFGSGPHRCFRLGSAFPHMWPRRSLREFPSPHKKEMLDGRK